MEIKIPKEVRQHKETIFFGLSVRQFACAVLAVGTAVGVYFLLKTIIGPETASWACIVAAAPVAVTGFFQYNGMTFEQFVWAYLKSQFLCAGPRSFQSENLYCAALTKKGVQGRYSYLCVDEAMRRRLEIKLITGILAFRAA